MTDCSVFEVMLIEYEIGRSIGSDLTPASLGPLSRAGRERPFLPHRLEGSARRAVERLPVQRME